jgi:hypothetical protein
MFPGCPRQNGDDSQSNGSKDTSDVLFLVAHLRKRDVFTRIGDFNSHLIAGFSLGHDDDIASFDFRNPSP